ncbi:hypothetical protein [Spirosoma arcticum]
MRLTPATVCLSTLLSLALLACQPPDLRQEPGPTASPGASRTDSYLFTGTPGIRTTRLVDITGTLTGTIGGQTIAFGPDGAFPVRAAQGYDLYSRNPSYLLIQARNEQYSVTLGFNGPFETGRSYRVYNPADDGGEGKFDAYIVQAFIRTPVDLSAREINDLSRADKQVRITAITPDYIDIEFDFTLKQAGAVPERIAVRVKNVLNENRNLRTQSEGEPYWDYTGVERMIEGWGYPTPPSGYPTTTRVRIDQRQLTTPGTDFSYEGKTEQANSQWISLTQLKSPRKETNVEYSFGTNWSAAGWKQTYITWPDFTGVGTYTGDQVDLSFTNDQGAAGYWRVRPGRLSSPATKWQVDVQRVTPDVIEGTYTIVDAPLYSQKGSSLPTSVSVSGRFRVIYPR